MVLLAWRQLQFGDLDYVLRPRSRPLHNVGLAVERLRRGAELERTLARREHGAGDDGIFNAPCTRNDGKCCKQHFL